MISGGELYTVISAVVPLYVAMFLAYGSVKWWKIFTPEQCAGINKFVAIFAVPLLSFIFISRINPYKMNFVFVAADVISKLVVLLPLALWTKFSERGNLDWVITTFSLSTLPNTLVMGIPLLKAMYGDSTESLMVQVVVMQCILWYTLMLFLFEYRSVKVTLIEHFHFSTARHTSTLDDKSPKLQTDGIDGVDCEELHVIERKPSLTSIPQRDLSTPSSERFHERRYKHTMSENSTAKTGCLGVKYNSMQSMRNLQSIGSTSPLGETVPTVLTNRVASFRDQSNGKSGNHESAINLGTENSCSNRYLGLLSEDAVQVAKIVSQSASNYSPQPRDDAKELHMFIWSSGSSFSEGKCTLTYNVCVTSQLHQQDNHKGEVIPSEPSNAAFVMKLILHVVFSKLAYNPNSYASLFGILWALVSARWGLEMPQIVKGSITILSDTGLGLAMFSLGLFMALQPRIIACGTYFAIIGMVLRFLVGPAVMAVASIAVGLRGTILHIAIVQGALPQGIVPFVFARQYNVHPDILSTGVIFGMLVSLPITLIYYVLLEL
ncbi:auxin efflux carrier component 2 [Cryptomeria japonica]|uniref:auxin efflux carrier component 2 n=1 Tax=Cryptomeria japonica TaxID=3369 RepID=UPI0027DA4572|nr:auxin efflux carrier component 2 [Cryptomeria japonica]